MDIKLKTIANLIKFVFFDSLNLVVKKKNHSDITLFDFEYSLNTSLKNKDDFQYYKLNLNLLILKESFINIKK